MAEKDNQQFLRCKFLSRRTIAGLAFHHAIKGAMLLVLLLTTFSVFAQRLELIDQISENLGGKYHLAHGNELLFPSANHYR